MKFESDYINNRSIKRNLSIFYLSSTLSTIAHDNRLFFFFSVKPETANLIFSPFISFFFFFHFIIRGNGHLLIPFRHFDAFIFINCQQENKKVYTRAKTTWPSFVSNHLFFFFPSPRPCFVSIPNDSL